MSDLSPAAQAALRAVTQREYSLDPEDIPNEASRLSSYIATALRAIADQVVPEEPLYGGDQRWMRAIPASVCRKKLIAIADELEQA